MIECDLLCFYDTFLIIYLESYIIKLGVISLFQYIYVNF